MDSVSPVRCIVLSGLGMDTTPRSYALPAGFTPDQRYKSLNSHEGCEKVFADLLELPPTHLGRNDFAMQNLLCAPKLPGSESLDIPKCLTRLDNLTGFVKSTIDHNIHGYKSHPDYGHCEPMWRMASLVTSVKRDFGARYDPVIRKEIEAGIKGTGIKDSKKLFIHGVLNDNPNERWGTCASIPVLVTAVARRLHYPVGLAVAGRHIYAKWEGRDGLCFNIEASNPQGMIVPTDQQCGEKINKVIWRSRSDNNNYYYLRTLYPAEELGLFLSIRVECLAEATRYDEAIPAAALSLQLAPDDPQFPQTAQYILDLAIRDRIHRTQSNIKLPPIGQPYYCEVGNLLHPAERAPFMTIVAHYKETIGEIEQARLHYEDACRMRYHGAYKQRDLQRFIKKHGPARRVGPLMPPKNCLRLRTVKCQPHEEAMILRRAADQFMQRGEVMASRDCLHDLYMFNPANAGVFQELRAIESQPGFEEMERAWNAKIKGKFPN